MCSFIDKTNNESVAFIDDIKAINSVKDLSSKKLCIIKTNFKDLNHIKEIIKNHPLTEFWLTSADISRKNIIRANTCGVKNVLPYPFDIKVIKDFFQKKTPDTSEDKYTASINSWMNGLKVMIVDDNPLNVELLTETLNSSGLSISTFVKPQEALDAILSEKFDLFLLDIMMPDISGFDLALQIKESELNNNAPIVFISALSDSEHKIAGYDIGSCAYIEKPFDVNVVRSQVFNILKSRKLQDSISKTKESFVAMVAHDLKSPVNAEITALELLLQKFQNKPENGNNEIITDLLQAAKYMKNLVDNILCKYKYENNKISLNKDLCSIFKLLNESISEIKYLAEDKYQKIIFIDQTKHSSIYVDYIEIKRVIHNLLSNSIEYAPRNSSINVVLSENKNFITVSIENQTNKFFPENIDKIFDKFISFANKSKCVNSGLGLFVAKNIINAHNGSIKAEIVKNKNIRFTFSLPKSQDYLT